MNVENDIHDLSFAFFAVLAVLFVVLVTTTTLIALDVYDRVNAPNVEQAGVELQLKHAQEMYPLTDEFTAP